MVTYSQLWRASPARWWAAAGAWRSLAALAERRSAEFPGHADALRRCWSGAAAGAAQARLGALRARLQACRPGWWEVDQALSCYAGELSRAKAMLAATVTAGQAAGVTVDPDGVVGTLPGPPDRARADAARRTVAGIAAALAAAARADQQTARQLADLAGAAAAGWPTTAPSSCPPVGGQPAQVRRWWAGLTDAERRWLVLHDPNVGRLDGVPVAARDRANRLRLVAVRAEVAGRRAAAAGKPRSARLRRLDELTGSLDALAARLDDPGGARAYLLGFDPAGDGRAVVALGDPDSADSVLTYVPGMTAELSDVDGELDRAGRVATQAGRIDPTARTAAVLWLDYDAPDFLDEAASARQARDAGPALHRFQEGLRATHDGAPARHTVLGHSYGSLVVGATAARYGLAADDLVFVGSPGVGVDSAADLGVPADRVWSSTAHRDVIQYAAVPAPVLAGHLALAAVVPGLEPALALRGPADELWFGRNPSDPSFGARVFTSQPDAGHVGYWDPGRPALDGLARITLGGSHHGQVR